MKRALLAVSSWLLAAVACSQIAIAQQASSQKPNGQSQPDDVLLRAMQDEIKRVPELIRLRLTLDPPYYTEYRVEDTRGHSIAASLGALIDEHDATFRIPSVLMRVGTANFDNTGHFTSEAYGGNHYDPGQLPLDEDYLAFRQAFWLATDRAYKTAEGAIARKRASLKDVNQPGQLPDFSAAPPGHLLMPVQRRPFAAETWRSEVLRLSALLAAYPKVATSSVEMQSSQSINYIVTSEGAELRTPEDMSYIRVSARGFTPDGASVLDTAFFHAFHDDGLPSEAVLSTAIKALGEDVTALSQAPAGEAYDGPVLFEAPAAAQLFAQLLGDNLKITRKPVTDPGRPAHYSPSELESKVGARILPEWIDVVDDPTQTQFEGRTLLGHYLYDMEGVAPQPLTLVEKGTLKAFPLTRTPVFKEYPGSNGHARMSGPFVSRWPGFGNVFVRVSQTTPAASMKNKLIELCRTANKPYGILIRKLDYPSMSSVDEWEHRLQAANGTHLLVPPLLAYKVYPDGREELVRGLWFHDVTTRALKDIVAASDEHYLFDWIDSNAPFALVGAGSFTTTSSLIAPAILFQELELEPAKEETTKPPIVPPPALSTQSPTKPIANKPVASAASEAMPHS